MNLQRDDKRSPAHDTQSGGPSSSDSHNRTKGFKSHYSRMAPDGVKFQTGLREDHPQWYATQLETATTLVAPPQTAPKSNILQLGEVAVGDVHTNGDRTEVLVGRSNERVQDLTPEITLVQRDPVFCGGFSDIFRGIWVPRRMERVGREVQVCLSMWSMVRAHRRRIRSR